MKTEKNVVGETIREYREKKRYSISKLSCKLGNSSEIIEEWEKGIGEPSTIEFIKLSQILGFDFLEVRERALSVETSKIASTTNAFGKTNEGKILQLADNEDQRDVLKERDKNMSDKKDHLEESKTEMSRKIGKYLLVKKLGHGGMGVVYKAIDEENKTTVALKFIRAKLAYTENEKQDRIKKFRSEAKKLFELKSPHVVKILDYQEIKDEPFIVMEFVEGEDLDKFLLRESPMDEGEALRLLSKICDCVETIHKSQIIHRDLKPSNILISENQTIKIADLGLAKFMDHASSFSTSGGIKCTPMYASPEQFDGKATYQSDLYSLGVILYKMIAGELPFKDSTLAEVIYQKLNFKLPENHKISKGMGKLLLKMMALSDLRHKSVGEVQSDIEKLLSSNPLDSISKIWIKTEYLSNTHTLPLLNKPADVPYLIFEDEEQTVIFPLMKKHFYLGRTLLGKKLSEESYRGNDLVVHDERISESNAVFIVEDAQVLVKNLSANRLIRISRGGKIYSKGGLSQNDSRKLSWGDIVDISGYKFRYRPNSKGRELEKKSLAAKSKGAIAKTEEILIAHLVDEENRVFHALRKTDIFDKIKYFFNMCFLFFKKLFDKKSN